MNNFNAFNTTIHSGRFYITKTKTNENAENTMLNNISNKNINYFEYFNYIIDSVVLELFNMIKQVYADSSTQNLLPLDFEFDTNGNLQNVTISDVSLFNKHFESKINILQKYNQLVKLTYKSEYIKYILDFVDDINLFKRDIMKTFGGNLFPMFPECVGYIYNLYSISLLKFEPHEFFMIDECIILKYIKQKLNQFSINES